jgi:hypothetical protein
LTDYENILKESCIFIDLEDCVANNTILECIKFNTPVITRRHPSIEEYIGKDYPLFFENGTLKFSSIPFSRPHYTLDGLYSTLGNDRMNAKINALQQELLGRVGYRDESICSKNHTRLKLLESKYKKLVSDQ